MSAVKVMVSAISQHTASGAPQSKSATLTTRKPNSLPPSIAERPNYPQEIDTQDMHLLADFIAYSVVRIWKGEECTATIYTSSTANKTFLHLVQRIYRVIRITRVSLPCLLIALMYLDRLAKVITPDANGSRSGSEYRLFCSSLILSQKYLDDNRYTNKTWSDVTGIPLVDLNVMESEYLARIQFSLYMTKSQYTQWLKQVQTVAADHSYARQTFAKSKQILAKENAPSTTKKTAADVTAAAAAVASAKISVPSAAVTATTTHKAPIDRPAVSLKAMAKHAFGVIF
ncbi:hypothetical protein HK102_012586 [Quaeritorhiza haematococci]|nr:hypothetical protein HK102_012586 [Quaeritorhiza haematococci]